MSLGKQLGLYTLTLLALAFTGCSGGGSSDAPNSMQAALQDLTVDADGLVTVISFASDAGLAGAATTNFSASGGQNATGVSVVGASVSVTWDALVSPAHTVTVTGLAGVIDGTHAVTTTDSSAPTYTITAGTMNAGLGADVITVQFAGPHVSAATAEDVTNWSLDSGGNVMDLTGSSFSLDANTQILTLNLGNGASVWSAITLAATGVKSVADTDVDGSDVLGTGSGDAVAPTLVSAEQNLGQDEFGRVIDFTFDEAISPICATQLARYSSPLPDVATGAVAVSPTVVRVTYNNPIVPGVNSISLNGLFDAHGNDFVDVVQPVTQPSPVVNTVDGNAVGVTVTNSGNDYLTLTTTQAFDPDSAEDYTNWTLHVAGNPIDLSTQTFVYDLPSKTTTITLDFDMHNGDTFTLVATNVVDVDGDHTALGDFQTVSGDTTAPSVVSRIQNRVIDPTGETVDVTFDEDLDQTAAETGANWSTTGTQNLVTATLLAGGDTVRLVFDAPMIPGVDDVAGANLTDLAGNTYSFSGLVSSSTDTTAPTILSSSANAIQGANDDTLIVNFDDVMWAASVTNPANWTLESPTGTPLSLAGCSVAYDAAHKRATLTLDTGVNLHNNDDYSIAFTNAFDVAHNALGATATTGTVTPETTLPEIVSGYLESSVNDEIVLSFSEPCDKLDDLYDSGTNPTGTRFVLRDNLGAQRGTATASSVLDTGLGVRLSFGVVIAPTDTLDVLGVTDLAGNPMFPVLAQALLAEDTTPPTILSATATTLTGEANDTIQIVFDRPMSSWNITDRTNFSLTMAGAGVVDLFRVPVAFDGNDTVVITLNGSGYQNLSTADNFTITATNLRSAQGVPVTGTTSMGPLAVVGDTTPPSVGVSGVRIDPLTADSLLVEFNEAVHQGLALTLANYDLNGGNLAIDAVLVGPRVARVTFAVTPIAGDSLDVIGTDLASNTSGVLTRTVQSADATAPLIASISGVSTSGYGGDSLMVVFNEPVQTGSAFAPGNYSITSNGNPISLAGATAYYLSATNAVVFQLASGQELDSSVNVNVTISNVMDVAGNAMPAPVATSGSVTGDTTPPAISGSFVNWIADPTGKTVDVLFSEDVASSAAGNLANWGTNSVVTVSAVQRLDDHHYRATLSAALGAANLVTIAALKDPANNPAGATLTTNPVE